MAAFNYNAQWVQVTQDVPATAIPDGFALTLHKDTEVLVMQSLGGDFTVRTRWGALYRIEGKYAEAIGQQPPASPLTSTGHFREEDVAAVLRTCYDPEIPVNILDLGLVYESVVEKLDDGTHRLFVKMTLTAPGCGMGEVMVQDVRRKLQALPEVSDVQVQLVFDPPWNPTMMTEAARLQTGMF